MTLVNGPIIKCTCCGRRVPQPVIGDSHQCSACNVLRVLNNSISDGVMMIHDLVRVRDDVVTEIRSAGGDVAQVRRLFRHLWRD